MTVIMFSSIIGQQAGLAKGHSITILKGGFYWAKVENGPG